MATQKSAQAVVQKILADVSRTPAVPEGPCVADTDIIDYALDLVEGNAKARLAKHIESCAICLEDVIELLDERRYWEGQAEFGKTSPSLFPGKEVEPAGRAGDRKSSNRRPRRK